MYILSSKNHPFLKLIDSYFLAKMNTTKPKAATKIPNWRLIRNISATPNGISQRPVFLPTDICLTSFSFTSVGDRPAHRLAGVAGPFLLIRRNSDPPSVFKPAPFFSSQSNPTQFKVHFNILCHICQVKNCIFLGPVSVGDRK